MTERALLERLFPKLFKNEKYIVEKNGFVKGFETLAKAKNYAKRKGGKISKLKIPTNAWKSVKKTAIKKKKPVKRKKKK